MKVFKELFKPNRLSSSNSVKGLFGIPNLRTPNDFHKFSESSLSKAENIYQELKTTKVAPSEVIIRLDKLSDTLCRVVDLAGFLRTSHPQYTMVEAAQQAHELLFGFMTVLNTDKDLYELVVQAIASGELNTEQLRVAEILKHDFMKSGIQFNSDNIRNEFIDLSNRISITSQQFLNSETLDTNEAQFLQLGGSELAGLKTLVPLIKQNFKVYNTQPELLQIIMMKSENPEVRKKIWQLKNMHPGVASQFSQIESSVSSQESLLDKILADRLSLANIAGYNTYAEYELSDKMMKTPKRVYDFLNKLTTELRPKVKGELNAMSIVAPWDYPYKLHNFRKNAFRNDSISNKRVVFDLASVFSTMNEVTQELYNLELIPSDCEEGEVWSPEVKKLDAKLNGDLVGHIYLDLASRDGKMPNPAHFTIQCSRKREDGTFQLPIIALVCDFETSEISFDDVQTIFHEMGHAIHSMLGRTNLHNVAGTRAATDFVEIPSILFEKFPLNLKILNMLSSNHKDTESFLSQYKKQQQLTANTEMWYQVNLSWLDQYVHGEQFTRTRSSQQCSILVTNLMNVYNIPNTELYTSSFAFGHLVTYGSTYYSYLLDRSLADKIYDKLFVSEPWSRGGEQWGKVLAKGGSVDPIELLSTIGIDSNF